MTPPKPTIREKIKRIVYDFYMPKVKVGAKSKDDKWAVPYMKAMIEWHLQDSEVDEMIDKLVALLSPQTGEGEKVDETLKHWGYGGEIEQTAVSAKGTALNINHMKSPKPQERKPSGQGYYMKCTICKTIYGIGEIHYCGKFQPPQPKPKELCPNCHHKIKQHSGTGIGSCIFCGCDNCQSPPPPSLQGKQDWEKRLRENFEVDGYIDCHIDVMIDFIQSAIHTTEKRMIEEMDKLVFEASDGIHTYGPIVWQIDKEGYDKLKSKVNHSKQGYET